MIDQCSTRSLIKHRRAPRTARHDSSRESDQRAAIGCIRVYAVNTQGCTTTSGALFASAYFSVVFQPAENRVRSADSGGFGGEREKPVYFPQYYYAGAILRAFEIRNEKKREQKEKKTREAGKRQEKNEPQPAACSLNCPSYDLRSESRSPPSFATVRHSDDDGRLEKTEMPNIPGGRALITR